MKGFSKECEEVIKKSYWYAAHSGGLLGSEHLLCGMMTTPSSLAYKQLAKIVLPFVPEMILQLTQGSTTEITVSERTGRIIEAAKSAAESEGRDITSSDLLQTMLADKTAYATRLLKRYGDGQGVVSAEADDNEETQFGGTPSDDEKSDIKELENMGCDLTEKARKHQLDPVIGRGEEIERIIQILSRRTKNNPVLIGEPGVGKSAIVEGLAQAIVDGNVPEMLKNKRVFSLDMASVVAGTKYRGEFEERLKKAIDAIKKDGDTILFIDEIHTIVGAGSGSEGNLDAANILKPQLARGELQTIGATTTEEYRKHIEKDSALERRFQPITVNPPSVADTVTILKGLREKYEKHHNVTIGDDALEAAAIMSDRYINDRFLPDKAIDLIDEAASKKRIGASVLPTEVKALEDEATRLELEKKDALKHENYAKCAEIKEQITVLDKEIEAKRATWNESRNTADLTVSADDIAQIVSSWTSIPVVKLTETESQKLLHLEEILKRRVIGQDEAVSAVAKAVRRARAGIKDPNRPIGSFIFLGPTGVGKTELSKALAEAMFGDENLLIRIDMSEYMDKINVSKLIGSAPGYVGYDEGGQLTEKVRRKPYSVVLFDEIEKAHPDVFNVLLQIMEDGRLTDSHGRTVSFKNTIVIMTSNIGADEIKQSTRLGFGSNEAGDYDAMREKQMDALKRTMKPEFINRIDDIIIFRALAKEDMAAIADIMIDALSGRLAERNIKINVDETAKKFIVEKGFDVQYGARPLRRSVQKMIEDELSEKILADEIAIGDCVDITCDGGKLIFAKSNSGGAEE